MCLLSHLLSAGQFRAAGGGPARRHVEDKCSRSRFGVCVANTKQRPRQSGGSAVLSGISGDEAVSQAHYFCDLLLRYRCPSLDHPHTLYKDRKLKRDDWAFCAYRE